MNKTFDTGLDFPFFEEVATTASLYFSYSGLLRELGVVYLLLLATL